MVLKCRQYYLASFPCSATAMDGIPHEGGNTGAFVATQCDNGPCAFVIEPQPRYLVNTRSIFGKRLGTQEMLHA